VRASVRAVDPELPLYRVATLEGFVYHSVAQPRFNMLLLSLFGVAAIVLAAMGIYGLLSHTVAERTHEIGVRMALGAQARDVLELFVGHGLRLTVLGLVLGMAGAFALTRVMESLLFGVSATDPTTFAWVVVSLAAIAALASYLPARRATRVDPMIALRHE
jgi:putative ABC transport system permease protein